MATDMQAVGLWIKQRRESMGWLQREQFAAAANISISTVLRAEQGFPLKANTLRSIQSRLNAGPYLTQWIAGEIDAELFARSVAMPDAPASSHSIPNFATPSLLAGWCREVSIAAGVLADLLSTMPGGKDQ